MNVFCFNGIFALPWRLLPPRDTCTHTVHKFCINLHNCIRSKRQDSGSGISRLTAWMIGVVKLMKHRRLNVCCTWRKCLKERVDSLFVWDRMEKKLRHGTLYFMVAGDRYLSLAAFPKTCSSKYDSSFDHETRDHGWDSTLSKTNSGVSPIIPLQISSLHARSVCIWMFAASCMDSTYMVRWCPVRSLKRSLF